MRLTHKVSVTAVDKQGAKLQHSPAGAAAPAELVATAELATATAPPDGTLASLP